MTVKTRFGELIARLTPANAAYHTQDAPLMTDAEYDALHREAEALCAAHPELAKEAEALATVGAPVAAGFKKIAHAVPMLSLDNVFATEEFAEFGARIRRFLGLDDAPLEFVAEPKIDGLSISITYENQTFVRAATRGDGAEGE